VNGTLNNPQTRQEVLPGLNETLQQLFPEQAQTTADRRPAWAGGLRLAR
jgi:hypothetical protein